MRCQWKLGTRVHNWVLICYFRFLPLLIMRKIILILDVIMKEWWLKITEMFGPSKVFIMLMKCWTCVLLLPHKSLLLGSGKFWSWHGAYQSTKISSLFACKLEPEPLHHKSTIYGGRRWTIIFHLPFAFLPGIFGTRSYRKVICGIKIEHTNLPLRHSQQQWRPAVLAGK